MTSFQITNKTQAKQFDAPVGTWVLFRHKQVPIPTQSTQEQAPPADVVSAVGDQPPDLGWSDDYPYAKECPVWKATGCLCNEDPRGALGGPLGDICFPCIERQRALGECLGCESGCSCDAPHRVIDKNGDSVYHPTCDTRAAKKDRHNRITTFRSEIEWIDGLTQTDGGLAKGMTEDLLRDLLIAPTII